MQGQGGGAGPAMSYVSQLNKIHVKYVYTWLCVYVLKEVHVSGCECVCVCIDVRGYMCPRTVLCNCSQL